MALDRDRLRTPMNVLLIDDHAMFREGVALLLRPLAADLQVSEAGTAEDGLAALERLGGADLVLVDIGLPGVSGLEVIGRVHARHPGTPVVALSSMDDRATVLGAVEAGAMGFISKTMNGHELRRRLQLILDGMVVLPAVAAAAVPAARPVTAPSPDAPITSAADLGITPRQADVLHLIVQGCVAKDIERRLQLSAGTVKAHTSAVLRALNVTTRTQAVVRAAQLGLRLNPPGPRPAVTGPAG